LNSVDDLIVLSDVYFKVLVQKYVCMSGHILLRLL